MPTAYTSERAEAVLAGISEGKSLRKICDELSLHAPDVRRWVVENKESFGEHYARARDLQFDVWADEIKELSDQCRVGVKVTRTKDKKGNVVGVEEVEADMLERTRQQIDSRKWLLSKLHHKRYGDKLAIGGAEDLGPVQLSWKSRSTTPPETPP
jgi:hypothetical protein